MNENAPFKVRGDFKAIDTSVPGIQICEKFPRIAQQMQHAAILRGMSTDYWQPPSFWAAGILLGKAPP